MNLLMYREKADVKAHHTLSTPIPFSNSPCLTNDAQLQTGVSAGNKSKGSCADIKD